MGIDVYEVIFFRYALEEHLKEEQNHRSDMRPSDLQFFYKHTSFLEHNHQYIIIRSVSTKFEKKKKP